MKVYCNKSVGKFNSEVLDQKRKLSRAASVCPEWLNNVKRNLIHQANNLTLSYKGHDSYYFVLNLFIKQRKQCHNAQFQTFNSLTLLVLILSGFCEMCLSLSCLEEKYVQYFLLANSMFSQLVLFYQIIFQKLLVEIFMVI